MNLLRKYLKIFLLRLSILNDFFKMLWDRKLWWGIPVIFITLMLMLLLLFFGHTGIAAFIYPLF